jgi:tetratricopeptide (TPR) repeat protein
MMQTRWVCLGLAVLTLVCYGHVCLGEFIHFDDPLYITGNPQVLGGLTWANVVWAFGASCQRAGYWIPLTWLSLQADATLFGPTGAWGFHLVNLLLHVANVVAFFLVLQRMTGDVGRSAMAAALFGLHPLRVESVAWVTERKDVLSTLLLILTVAAYVRYVEQPNWRRYGLMFGVFLLGLMAKPTLVTLPFALLLLDYWPLNRLRLGQSAPAQYAKAPAVSWRWLILEKLPLLAAVAAIVPITLHYASAAIVAGVPWHLRIAIALSAYLGYLENTFWPINLAMLYPGKLPSAERVALAGLVLAAITLGAIYLARRQPAIIVGWLWFLGTMFPVSGIAQTGPQALADRYTYVPHLGLAIAVVWGVSDSTFWRRLSGSLQKAIAFLVLAGLGALTWMQVGYWRDSDILFSHTLSVTKDNYLIHQSLAEYWLEQHQKATNAEDAAKILDQAEAHLDEAVKIADRIAPRDFGVRFAYGVLLVKDLGRPADAVPHLQKAVDVRPNDPGVHYWLGEALAKLGRRQEAEQHWQTALTLHPEPALASVLEDRLHKKGQALPVTKDEK